MSTTQQQIKIREEEFQGQNRTLGARSEKYIYVFKS